MKRRGGASRFVGAVGTCVIFCAMRAIQQLLFVVILFAAACKSAPAPPYGPEFRALFNGRDLDGWKGLVEMPTKLKLAPADLAKAQAAADAKMRAHWSVNGLGELEFDGKGESLVTEKDYEDFELYIDWKIKKDGDSGIYLRGMPQVQIWDNPIGSGGLYNNSKNLSKPLTAADRPVGQWNTFRIKMIGDRVWVWLNAQLVVDNVPLENGYWSGVHKTNIPPYTKGPIELQNHGNTLWFRNIYIREIGGK
ncbi:MAG: DUF1080 domain-containing protein [Planctomycetota bacterium]